MRTTLVVVVSVMFAVGLSGMAVAGSMDSPGAPSLGSGMYTLQNLYDYLTSGDALSVAGDFQEPSAAPGSTMKSTKEIGDAIKALFEQCPVMADNVESGVKFFCTQPGSWGVRTGTLVALPRPTATPTVTPTATWACGSTFTDSRDGKVYSTVLIGSQCWMKQNLNVGTRIDTATDQGTSCSSIQKYCRDNLESGCETYGGHYQMPQAMCGSTEPGTQGICFDGWHVATEAEWCTLLHSLDSTVVCGSWEGRIGTNVGTKLMLSGPNDFSEILAGLRIAGGSFVNLGSGYFPSSNLRGDGMHRHIENDPPTGANVGIQTCPLSFGESIRCLRD
ncbi:MAG: hypothetical protein NTZ78_09360 [Candidatus Aureabacteria bacterium]|nr:hypothetical protein [Candidatus Auribacterota bacterium]